MAKVEDGALLEGPNQKPAGDGPLSVHDAVLLASSQVDALPQMCVVGEVSGFRGPNARSGHCYFRLKDEMASMDAIVWRGTYQRSGITLKDGLRLQMTGRFNVYQASGKLSFVARQITLEGEGLLRQQVAALARKLEAEGLMDPGRKRPIPRFCTRVCVATSLSGAVIDDVKRTLARRNPLVEIQVVPCAVQGPDAPATIIHALHVAAAARPDAVLLVRGGGSFEDLMCFNDEALARAVAACPVPVITGIGHEPDTTICDMVSDRRCSTPTAAAESIAPAMDEIASVIDGRADRLLKALDTRVSLASGQVERLSRSLEVAGRHDLDRRGLALEALAQRPCLKDPRQFLRDRDTQLTLTEERLHEALPRSIDRSRQTVRRLEDAFLALPARILSPFETRTVTLAQTLDALSPLKVLARGYGVVRTSGGKVVSDASVLSRGEDVRVLVARGSFDARVTGVNDETGDLKRDGM